LEDLIRFPAQVWFATGYLRERIDLLVEHERYLLPVHSQFLEDKIGYIFANLHHSMQHMCGFNCLLTATLCQVYGLLNRFL